MFKNDPNYKTTQWIDVENEHFIVWMQMESFSDFIKLYGRINSEIKAGTYYLKVNSSKKILFKLNFKKIIYNHEINFIDYDVKSFGGTKSVLITTASSLGRAPALGWILILGLFSCLIMIIVFVVITFKFNTPLYNYHEMKWE